MNRKEKTMNTLQALEIGVSQVELANDPEFSEIMNNFIYADIYNQGNITHELRLLINLVVLTTIQEYHELKKQILHTIEFGINPIKIKESIYQCAPFIGYPKIVSALSVINGIFQDQKINLPLENQKTVNETERYTKGKEIQYPIYGDRIIEAMKLLPDEQKKKIPQFLTENCFGDFYTRDGIEIQTRELLILCIFCALGGCEPQIRSHTHGNLNVGNSKEVIVSAITHCIPLVGFSRVLNALNIIQEIV